MLHVVVATSFTTKGPLDEINLPILNIYTEKIIAMEETSRKKKLVDVYISFLPGMGWGKTVTYRMPFPAFLSALELLF